MKDVAEMAKVSQSTVSRVLSGAPPAIPISESTRARVLDTATRLGYRPNPLARGLRGAPTMLIGAIVRDVTDPFFAVAIDALSRHARRRDYSVVLGHAREQAREALALAAVLEARQCDAIVLLGDVREEPGLLEDLGAVDGPVVELWRGAGDGRFPAISVDNAGGMRMALRHLSELGHERIAFVGDPEKADIAERLTAYRERGDQVVTVRNTAQDGAAALDALLDGPQPPTAVAAATDLLAFGLLHRAAARGLRVPDDLSVTGFDDIPLAASAVPALSTVRMPIEAMAEAAVELAIDGVADTPAFAGELVVRASTAPPGGGGRRLQRGAASASETTAGPEAGSGREGGSRCSGGQTGFDRETT
jgi:DNA-binding LacI/PurR family transcriptional regulator